MTTCATFFAHRYDAPYIDPALIVLVGAMGVGRLADRGHWLSDQTVGIAFGYAVGREVARRQLSRLARERTEGRAAHASQTPILDTEDRVVRVGWQIVF